MLYIMRHGTTDWNKLRKLQGNVDIPLNDEGRRMARKAGERYRDVHLDLCFVSPLIRAKETAELFLAGRDVESVVDERIREMSFGICEGVVNPYENDCPVHSCFVDPAHYEKVEGGESFDEVYARTQAFLDELVLPRVKSGLDILIVGHGAVNASIVNQVKNIPRERYWECGLEQCVLNKIIG